jgi:hypothetical protein
VVLCGRGAPEEAWETPCVQITEPLMPAAQDAGSCRTHAAGPHDF